MRQMILSLMTSLALTVAMIPQKSEAGLLIGFAAGNPLKGAIIGNVVGGTTALSAYALMGGEVFSSEFFEMTPMVMGIWILPATLLDVDASQSTDQLMEAFRGQFPFIDNTEALNALAQAAKSKILEQTSHNPNLDHAMVSLSREELSSILSASDLNQLQFNQVVDILK